MKKITILLILLVAGNTFAQLFPNLGGQRAGISTAQFLKIGVGARAAALGEAFVAMADDASALYWNPAGAVQVNQHQVFFSHNEWLIDIQHEFAGGIYKLSENDAIGVSLTSLHMEDMPVTTEFQPFGTGEYFTVGSFAVALTYSRRMTSQFSFGGTIRYIEETLDKLKMRGVMIDLGTMYYTGLGTSRFAVTISNFGDELSPEGEVKLQDGSTKSDWQSFSPPTMFRIGFAVEPYQTEQHRFTTSIQLNHPNDNSENVATGVEYAYKELMFLRGGYKFNVEEQNFSFGVGLKVPAAIADVIADYSYTNFERLGQSHRFSIILGIY